MFQVVAGNRDVLCLRYLLEPEMYNDIRSCWGVRCVLSQVVCWKLICTLIQIVAGNIDVESFM